jgi:hypothetical protein
MNGLWPHVQITPIIPTTFLGKLLETTESSFWHCGNIFGKFSGLWILEEFRKMEKHFPGFIDDYACWGTVVEPLHQISVPVELMRTKCALFG